MNDSEPDPSPSPEVAPPTRPEIPILITEDLLASPVKKEDGIDFEKGMSYFPSLSLGLILVNFIGFGLQLSSGSLESQETIIASGALHHASVLRGEVWRLVSMMFLHGSASHLLGNCLVLYILGMACEHALGCGRTFLVYFFSGLFGSFASFLASPGPSVGASGAIFGLLASAVVFFYRHQHFLIVRDKRIGVVLAVWAVYQMGVGLATPLVDNYAHLGGFLGGALITLFLKSRLNTH